jgi:hypothetical protein
MLIGVVGFIGSGKGTVGDILSTKGFVKDSFAKPLKDAVSCMFGWPRELLEGDTEVSRKWREKPDEFWSEKFGRPFSPREALQLMGTEAGREVFHKDLWVISLLNRAKGRNVVVTDVRFKNEIKYIQDNGGYVIRVRRGDEPDWYETAKKANFGHKEELNSMLSSGIHKSEWDWIGCYFNFEIENNGTLEDLGTKIDDMLTFIKKMS